MIQVNKICGTFVCVSTTTTRVISLWYLNQKKSYNIYSDGIGEKIK